MRIPQLRRLCIFAFVCMSLVSIAPGQNNSGKFIVGVLQESGEIIPFARYDGARWVNTWPAPTEPSKNSGPSVAPVPREWLGETPPTEWRLWLSNGTTHEIRVTRPAYLKNPCGNKWVLNTDFPKALNQRPNTCPVRAIGIVLSTDQEVLPMLPADHSQLAFGGFEKAAGAAEIREMRESNAERARLIARRLPAAGLPWDLAAPSRLPMRVEHAFAAQRESGEVISYVEANRRFDDESDPGCSRYSAFRGWTSRDVSRNDAILSITVHLTDCDFKEAAFTTPIALLELKEGTFAIAQVNGWESQSYAILKIGPAEVTTVLDSPVR